MRLTFTSEYFELRTGRLTLAREPDGPSKTPWMGRDLLLVNGEVLEFPYDGAPGRVICVFDALDVIRQSDSTLLGVSSLVVTFELTSSDIERGVARIVLSEQAVVVVSATDFDGQPLVDRSISILRVLPESTSFRGTTNTQGHFVFIASPGWHCIRLEGTNVRYDLCIAPSELGDVSAVLRDSE
jgi:hypothetical protein